MVDVLDVFIKRLRLSTIRLVFSSRVGYKSISST